jgi:hypothetical protein
LPLPVIMAVIFGRKAISQLKLMPDDYNSES